MYKFVCIYHLWVVVVGVTQFPSPCTCTHLSGKWWLGGQLSRHKLTIRRSGGWGLYHFLHLCLSPYELSFGGSGGKTGVYYSSISLWHTNTQTLIVISAQLDRKLETDALIILLSALIHMVLTLSFISTLSRMIYFPFVASNAFV